MPQWEPCSDIILSGKDPRYAKVQKIKVQGRVYGPLAIHSSKGVVTITHRETGYGLATAEYETRAMDAVELIYKEAADALDFKHPALISKKKKIKLTRALILAASENLILVKGSPVKRAMLRLVDELDEYLEFIDKKKSH